MNASPRNVMRTPRGVDVEITARCNLRCRYCYFFENPAVTYADLPAEAWLTFFEECERCAVMHISLAGGEPFMRDDLPVLIEGIVRHRMRFSLLSNGLLLTDEIAAFLAQTNRCDYVQISVDGSHAATHEAIRGNDSFDGAIRGLQILQRHNVPVTVRVTLHRRNVHDLPALAAFLLEDLNVSGFTVNAAGNLGACRQQAQEILLSTQQRQGAMETLLRLTRQYPGRIAAMAGPLAEARIWRRMATARLQSVPPFTEGGRLTGCGCVLEKIAVRADGVFVPCSMLAHLALGRINLDGLADVWQQSAPLKQLRDRQQIPLTAFVFCTDCAYVAYCTGNCPGMAYALTGQVNHPSPDACLRRFLEHGGRLPEVAADALDA